MTTHPDELSFEAQVMLERYTTGVGLSPELLESGNIGRTKLTSEQELAGRQELLNADPPYVELDSTGTPYLTERGREQRRQGRS